MTADIRKLQDAMNRADIKEIGAALNLYGECACEEMTGQRCKVCKAWVCGACHADHQRWHMEDDPKNERRF